MPKPLYVLLFILLIDAIGLGLIMPILPGLLASLSQDVAHNSLHYGVLLAVYALMQFLCAPVLGALSDRYGRRRVLLLSLAGAALDYVLMAYAPSLGWLYLGRVVAGITGANMAVATAYLTDITPQGQRAARFGQMGAAVGIGMIAGPVLGGWLGDWWVRAPFLLAAVLNALSLLLVWLVLPESRPVDQALQQRPSLNAFSAFQRLQGRSGLLPLVCVFGVLALCGQWPGTLWILYGQDHFGWTPWVAGLSLAGYGLCHALAQAFAIGPLVARLGEARALLLGLVCDALGLLLLAFAVSGWEPFALLPLFAVGGMAVPALQSMMTRLVSDAHQGALQGTLASMASLAGVVGPLVVAGLYTVGKGLWPGLIWVLGAFLYLLALPLLQRYRRSNGGQAALV